MNTTEIGFLLPPTGIIVATRTVIYATMGGSRLPQRFMESALKFSQIQWEGRKG